MLGKTALDYTCLCYNQSARPLNIYSLTISLHTIGDKQHKREHIHINPIWNICNYLGPFEITALRTV